MRLNQRSKGLREESDSVSLTPSPSTIQSFSISELQFLHLEKEGCALESLWRPFLFFMCDPKLSIKPGVEGEELPFPLSYTPKEKECLISGTYLCFVLFSFLTSCKLPIPISSWCDRVLLQEAAFSHKWSGAAELIHFTCVIQYENSFLFFSAMMYSWPSLSTFLFPGYNEPGPDLPSVGKYVGTLIS